MKNKETTLRDQIEISDALIKHGAIDGDDLYRYRLVQSLCEKELDKNINVDLETIQCLIETSKIKEPHDTYEQGFNSGLDLAISKIKGYLGNSLNKGEQNG